MNLNLRPMPEAPTGEDIVVRFADETYSIIELSEQRKTSAVGFILLSDVLAAVDAMRAITPKGYVFDSFDPEGVSADLSSTCRMVYFRKLPEPVNYEYVTDGKKRRPKPGDFIEMHGGFGEVHKTDPQFEVQFCYRRVEVKR